MSELLLLLFTKEWHQWFARDSRKSLSKMSNFLYVFDSFSHFPPFLCPIANSSCHPSQKSNREQFSPVPHYKRAIEPIRSFSWANCSFAHKKWAIRSKNWWANSQPANGYKNIKWERIWSLNPGSSKVHQVPATFKLFFRL